jgi:RimJ/RimL family protein N-acetyltransferase
MTRNIPPETIEAFAKTIFAEGQKYGFSQVDFVRLINGLMDQTADEVKPFDVAPRYATADLVSIDQFPLRSKRLKIRQTNPKEDLEMLRDWSSDAYGKHFLLSCSSARITKLEFLLNDKRSHVGIVSDLGDEPIGCMAFLDVDETQKRAELRKLIGAPDARGQGYAEEATRLWLAYGVMQLGLEKVFVSTLQTHLRNIQLNESVGFRVEGVLRKEVLISGERHDVLRMAYCPP